jgi:hypothetical protein
VRARRHRGARRACARTAHDVLICEAMTAWKRLRNSASAASVTAACSSEGERAGGDGARARGSGALPCRHSASSAAATSAASAADFLRIFTDSGEGDRGGE